jgi:hypothetical protein
MKKLYLIISVTLFFQPIIFADNSKNSFLHEMEKTRQGEINKRESAGFYNYFPEATSRTGSSSLALWSVNPKLEGAFGQDPGFLNRFSEYVGNMASNPHLFDESLRGAIAAIGLATLEETFPEMSTIIKHFNALAWQKKKLEAFNNQAVLNNLEDAGALPSKRVYLSCVFDKMLNEGKSREDAEVSCTDRIDKVYDFLHPTNKHVQELSLYSSTIAFAKQMRSAQRHGEIPEDAGLSEISKIVGEIKVTHKGKITSRSNTFVNWISNTHKKTINDINSLVGLCSNMQGFLDKRRQNPQSTKATCLLTPDMILPFESLKNRYAYTLTSTVFIDPLQIQKLANLFQPNQDKMIEFYAAMIATIKAEILLSNWKNIVSLAKTREGSEEFHAIYDDGIEYLESQLKVFKMQQRHNAIIYTLKKNISTSSVDFMSPIFN